MKRFTIKEFRYPEDSPLARLQELENMIEDGELSVVIPSFDEDRLRELNDTKAALSSERMTSRFYKHRYEEAREVPEKIFGELEATFCTLAYPVVTAVGTIETERAEGLHISSEDYEAIKKRYTEEQNDGEENI